MKNNNFFAELKRRNVYKVAVAYAVFAWLVIQVASIVLPTFHAPELLNLPSGPVFDELHGDPRFEALLQKVVGPKLDAKISRARNEQGR